MIINFECNACGTIFDSMVGKVSINPETLRPDFENSIFCPECCCDKTIDEISLTEVGQGQLTQATFDLQ